MHILIWYLNELFLPEVPFSRVVSVPKKQFFSFLYDTRQSYKLFQIHSYMPYMWSRDWNCNKFGIRMQGVNSTPLDVSDFTRMVWFSREDV